MKCSKCGKEIANDSNYCEYCGTKVTKAKNKTIIWIVLVLCVIGLFVGVIIYYENELDTYRYCYYNVECSDTAIAVGYNEESSDSAIVVDYDGECCDTTCDTADYFYEDLDTCVIAE